MHTYNALTFLGFFLAGLAVNLTPCVYPMLTVTVSLFKPRHGQTVRHSFSKALVFVLGMALMYSTLGYFAASTGKLFGSILQNSFVVGLAGMFIMALGLSMLGLFKLYLPTHLLDRVAGLKKVGYLGLFASGMFVGLFACPCVGPPVLALLAAVADNGDPRFGLSAFFVFSMGLGLPYLVLGTFSGLLTKLPKAGKWLHWVERVFGVVLLGLGAFYLALAFHVQWPGTMNISGVRWQPYSIGRAQELAAEHKPAVVDFYADWCLSCKELEHETLSNPEVAAKLAQVATLRVDATNVDDPKVSALIDKYGIVGLPTVLFLDSNGNEIKAARVEGAVKKEKFLKSLGLLK